MRFVIDVFHIIEEELPTNRKILHSHERNTRLLVSVIFFLFFRFRRCSTR